MNSAERERLRAKVGRIEGALTEFYGVRVWDAASYSDDVLGALVATILSQNTSDLNSGRAYASLRTAFPEGWDTVRTANVSDVAGAIRPGGLAQMKAPRIQAILQDVHERHGRTDLDHIRAWDDEDIRAFLRSFPGVGPKTAACVLMFNLGRPVLPVDTHVHRVAGRLGLIGPKTTADQAHDQLQALLDQRPGVFVPRPFDRTRPPRLPRPPPRMPPLPPAARMRLFSRPKPRRRPPRDAPPRLADG